MDQPGRLTYNRAMRRVVRMLASSALLGLLAGEARAAPDDVARARYKEAAALAATDDNEPALTLVEEGLAAVPTDLKLLQLKGSLHLKMRDYANALAAYQAYLDAGAQGAKKREAQKIVNNLRAVKTTFLEITSSVDPTAIYLDTKVDGVFCTTPCKRPMLPGDYKVIAERPGFDRWTGRVTVVTGKIATIPVSPAEQPSPLTIKVAPAGAGLTLDGKPVEPTAKVPAGTHELVVTLPGHATVRRELVAREGAPIDVDLVLVPLVTATVSPAVATLELDGKPLPIKDGQVELPVGAHVLVARAPKHRETRLEIPADRGPDYRLAITLDRLGAFVELAGTPAGARVRVDDQPVGTTPLAAPIELPAGEHTVEVTVPGYRPYRTRAAFEADQRVRLEPRRLVRDDQKRALIAGAASGAVLFAAGAFSLSALAKEDDYAARARLAGVGTRDPMLQDLKSSGQNAARFADIGFGLTVVGLGVTTYFFLVDRRPSTGTLRLGVGPGGAVATGTF